MPVSAQAERLKSLRVVAQEDANRQFGFRAVAQDYYVPAVLAAIAALATAYVLIQPEFLEKYFPEEGFRKELKSGVFLGALGAYVYVVMMLGDRSFQRDITSGISIWTAVQLMVGPVLGGVAARIVQSTVEMNTLAREAIYFFAGLAPRELVSFVQNTVWRLFSSDQPLTKGKWIPLQTVGGINQRIEDRLFEEGISDGYLLAMADPIRLYRNTPYDLRQIVAWINECLLFANVPEYAALLQKQGITGAIDLAYYWEMKGGEPHLAKIEQLAKLINADKTMLADVIRRLFEDAQVQLIWTLYQSEGDN